MARGFFANWNLSAQRGLVLLAVIAGGIGTLSDVQSQGRTMTTSDTLGANVRRAMIDIFRKKDPTAVDRYFGEPFKQHDPDLADGLAGMKSFATEIASSPGADITIYRTLVDGDFVLLHSRYQGVGRHASLIAFDLFRFDGGKIVEHWGGQEAEAPPNRSGRTQVDGPTEVLDRERPRNIGRWCARPERLSWFHCASIASKSLLRTLTMRNPLRRSEMELPG